MKEQETFLIISDKLSVSEKRQIIIHNMKLLQRCGFKFHAKVLGEMLAYCPLPSNKMKTFINLPKRGKKGFLYRYVFKCAIKNNVPKIFIDEVFNYKKFSDENENKEYELYSKYTKLIIAVCQNAKSKQTRQRKLDEIFGNG